MMTNAALSSSKNCTEAKTPKLQNARVERNLFVDNHDININHQLKAFKFKYKLSVEQIPLAVEAAVSQELISS